MAVLAACAGWALVSAGANGGRAEGMLLAVLAVAAGYAAGRMSGALLPVAAPCAAALAGLALTVAAPELSPGPESAAPLGRAGAEAAVLTLVAGLACCAAWASPVVALRLALRLLAAVTGAALGSVAAVVTCCGVLLASLAAGRTGRGAGVVGLAAAFAWLLHALWRSPRPTPVALTAGACLTALAALALVGNVLSFTTVSAGVGLLAGIATARPLPEETRGPGGVVRAYEGDVAR